MWFQVLAFPSLSKIEWFDQIVWSSKWNLFPGLLFACSTDGTKRLVIRLAHLQNSAKILVLDLHLCSGIWVCIMIGLLKKAIVDLPIRLKGNSKLSWGLGTRISVFLPTHLRLQHRLCFCISLFIMLHKVVVTFLKKYDHSNETSLAVLWHKTVWLYFGKWIEGSRMFFLDFDF